MLFERLRRPRWQHPDANVRRSAVARVERPVGDGVDPVVELARHDPDGAVRAVAVKRLDDLDELRNRLDADEDGRVREALGLRLRQLLTGGVGDRADLAARVSAINALADAKLLAHVLRNGREEAIRAAALERSGYDSFQDDTLAVWLQRDADET